MDTPDSTVQQTQSLSLKELLLSSQTMERALGRMCNMREFTHPINNEVNIMYSFDLEKCMEHLAQRYDKIKRHLAHKYVNENRGLITDMRCGANQKRQVIKQETKETQVVKSESIVKSEIKSEHAQQP